MMRKKSRPDVTKTSMAHANDLVCHLGWRLLTVVGEAVRAEGSGRACDGCKRLINNVHGHDGAARGDDEESTAVK